MRSHVACGCLLLASCFLASPAVAQQAVVSTPFVTASDSFYESFGVGFAAQGEGWSFRGPGAGSNIPQFGGFDPNVGLSTDFAFGGPEASFALTLNAGSGSRRSFTSQTPMVTVPNGGFGMIQDTTWRPFITQIIPIVGDYKSAEGRERLRAAMERGRQAALRERASRQQEPESANSSAASSASSGSSADRGDLSLAEIRRRQASQTAAADDRVSQLLAAAEEFERQGLWTKARVARLDAIEAAGEDRRDELRDGLRAMERRRRESKAR